MTPGDQRAAIAIVIATFLLLWVVSSLPSVARWIRWRSERPQLGSPNFRRDLERWRRRRPRS